MSGIRLGLREPLARPYATAVKLTSDTGGGVPRYRTFDDILYELLLGADGLPLQGSDGFFLYGVA